MTASWDQDRGWITGRLSELTEDDDRQDKRLEQLEARQREHSQKLHMRDLNTAMEVGKLRVEMREMEGRLNAKIAELNSWRKVWTPLLTGIVVAIVSYLMNMLTK